jgi:hypothetical protein
MKTIHAMLIAWTVGAACLADASECRVPQGPFTIKFQNFSVPAGDRIVAFEITLSGRSVAAVHQIPHGWSLKVDVDAAQSKVTGTPVSGAELNAVTELPALDMGPAPEPPPQTAAESVLQPPPQIAGQPAPQPAPQTGFTADAVLYTSEDLKTYVRNRFQCRDLVGGGR